MSATVFGQAHSFRLSVFSGAGYNHDYNIFSYNVGTEYAYYLSSRVYVLGTFYSNFKSLKANVTVSNSDTNQLETMDIPIVGNSWNSVHIDDTG